MKNIKNISKLILSNQWATLHKIEYDFKFKKGEWKRVSRESYNRGNGVAILLYNMDKKHVILTKQFRMPIYENNPQEGYSIEVCAGVLDKGENPESCVIREVKEEVGIEIDKASPVMEAYMSPGAVTEKMYFFIAEYTDKMKLNSGGGLDSEDEEIEVLEIPFQTALNMVYKSEIKDAKTIILLQYATIKEIFTK